MQKNRSRQSDDEYVRGGKGRRDEVGRSGIYPASAVDVPDGAEPRGQEELGHVSPHSQALKKLPDTAGDHAIPEFEHGEVGHGDESGANATSPVDSDD